LKAKTKNEKYARIMEYKKSMKLEDLCQGMPKEFYDFLRYTRSLKFDEKPDYRHYIRLFKELFMREGFEYDYVFDWLLIPHVLFLNFF
jgi:hypothetical protein